LIIAKALSIQVLADAEVIASDGTFKSRPVERGGKRNQQAAFRSEDGGDGQQAAFRSRRREERQKGWSQVYVIHARVNGSFVPAAIAFLSMATTGSYLVLLQAIRDWISDNFGKRRRPKLILTDFEAAIRTAITRFFEGECSSLSLYS